MMIFVTAFVTYFSGGGLYIYIYIYKCVCVSVSLCVATAFPVTKNCQDIPLSSNPQTESEGAYATTLSEGYLFVTSVCASS